MLELEQRAEEVESVLAQLKVDVKDLLVDLNELSSQGQDTMILKPTRESVARYTS